MLFVCSALLPDAAIKKIPLWLRHNEIFLVDSAIYDGRLIYNPNLPEAIPELKGYSWWASTDYSFGRGYAFNTQIITANVSTPSKRTAKDYLDRPMVFQSGIKQSNPISTYKNHRTVCVSVDEEG